MVPHPIKEKSKALTAMPSQNLIEYVHDQGIPLGLISRSAIKARSSQTHTPIGPPNRQFLFTSQILDCFTLAGWCQSFFAISPFIALFSRVRSATICLNSDNWASNSLIRFKSKASSPPYLNFHF
jgi:hypothetical protein